MSISNDFFLLGDGPVCFDLETALIPMAFKGRRYLRLAQFYSEKHSFWYDLKTFNEADWQELKECIEFKEREWIGHNFTFDIACMQEAGIQLKGDFNCTMIMSKLIYNGLTSLKHTLKDCVKRELDIEIDKELQSQNWMDKELTADDIEYAMNDVKYTYELFHRLRPKITDQGLEMVYVIERYAQMPTIEMERTGIKLDTDILSDQMVDLREEASTSYESFIEMLEADLPDEHKLPRNPDGTINLNKKSSGYVRLGTKVYAGFNPGSSKQLLEKFNAIGVEPIDPFGKPSVNQDYLKPWEHMPVVRMYLQWKTADKAIQMATTLIKAVDPDDGRIHASFNQTGTTTGRYSSSNPNMQNVPKKGLMRHSFVAGEGRVFCDLDFKGMELRACCADQIADEPRMRDVFAQNGDLHDETAARMFNLPIEEVSKLQRKKAKALNFCLLYGGSSLGIINYFAKEGIPTTPKEADLYRRQWLDAYPNIRRWHNDCKARAADGQPVIMVDGRRRYLLGDQKKHTVFCNNMVQGSCASVVKLAMYGIWLKAKDIDPTARIVAQVHDSIMIECKEEFSYDILTLAHEEMFSAGQEIFGDSVEFRADGSVGQSWGEAK